MRTFDADRVNYLVNHPAIRPTCGGDITQPLDCTEIVSDHQNVFVGGEHGGFSFIWTAPRVFEVHAYLLPEGRGKWGFEFGMNARNYMAEHADMLWARVDNPALRYFTMKAGFTPCGQNLIGAKTYNLYKWEY